MGVHVTWPSSSKCFTRIYLHPGQLVGHSFQHAEKTVCFEHPPDHARGVNRQRLKFPQQKQSKHLVQIGAGENDSLNGGITLAVQGFGLEFRV